MKKSILSLFLLLVVATVTNAAPRFGVIAEQGTNDGLGAFITDDMYSAQVTFASTSVDSPKTSNTYLTIGGSYKIALDSVTALTTGVDYSTISGDNEDKNTTIALTAGLERSLSSNIVLTTQIDVYSQNTDNSNGGADVKTTNIFSNGRVGVAYLF